MSELIMKDCSNLFGTRKVNATWNKEMADDISKMSGFDYDGYERLERHLFDQHGRSTKRKKKMETILNELD